MCGGLDMVYMFKKRSTGINISEYSNSRSGCVGNDDMREEENDEMEQDMQGESGGR